MITTTAITAATAPMSIPTDMDGLLPLIWLTSPALPVGGFSYSEGLEATIDHGLVVDESTCSHWLVDQLLLSQARADLAALAQALTAWTSFDRDRLKSISCWILTTRESSELRLQSLQMGKSLLDWMRNLEWAPAEHLQYLADLTPTYPLAYALALSATKTSPEQALKAYAFGWCENMTQAALKAVPLGQNSGQRMLAELTRHIPEAIEIALRQTDDTRQAFTPMLAILSSRHENQYSRLFRS